MSFGRRDYRDPAKEKFGKPTISYPDDSVLHPTLTDSFSHRKDSTTGALPFLTPSQNPSAQGCYLTKQASSKGDDDSSNLNVIYDRLPGVVKTTYPIDETYGIATKVQTQVIIAVENPPWVGQRYSAELVFTPNTLPSANDTVTVGTVTYKFVAALTGSANEVLIASTLAGTLYNLASAINVDWGIGVNFGTGTLANANAVAWFSLNVLVVADINTPSAPVAIAKACASAAWNTESILVTTATLTLSGNVSNGDTVTVGGKTYVFQTVLTNVDGNVLIGANAGASLGNLKLAINLGTGSGTDYAAATTANPAASAGAVSGSTLPVTATGVPTPLATTSGVASWPIQNTTTRLYIEEKEIDVNRVYRIASRVIFPLPAAVTYAFGHDVSLPDTLQSLSMVWDQSQASGASTQSRNSYGGARAEASASNYTDGGLLVEIINGFRGIAIAQYTRAFSLTPPLPGNLPTPTLIKPSLGTLLVRSVGESLEQSNGDLGNSASASGKVAFKTQSIGPVLTNNISLSGLQVKGVAVALGSGGSGYTSAPVVAINGGTFTVQATAVAQIDLSSGEVTNIIVTNPGNYTVVPSSVSFSGGGGSSATATASLFTVDSGTGDYTPNAVTAYAASPDGNSLYPAASVTAEAESHAQLAMPNSTPQSFSKGDQIVAAVNVQQWRLGVYMIETVTVTVPG